MPNRFQIPRLLEVNDIAVWVAAIILIPLIIIVYGVVFVSMVLIPRVRRGEERYD